MSLYALSDIVALVRHSQKSSSYKPALLKALVRVVGHQDALSIPLVSIAHEFTALYWNQTVVFHLRQAASITKEPEIPQHIRACSQKYNVRNLRDVPPKAVAELDRKIAHTLTINVLQLFHTSKPTTMPPLFTWEKPQLAVTISVEAQAFIRRYASTLDLIANYWWASYLEKVNLLAPAIIEKVSRLGAQRTSLTKYLRILATAGQDHCFYCESEFSDTRVPCVDHVLPWSFLLDDPVWDLVLACNPCNGSKSDRLPDRTFMEKLAQRNQLRVRELAGTRISPLIDDAKLFQLYDAAVSLEWPGPWSPGPFGR